MNIIYFTTAIDEDDYDEYTRRWRSSINPTTQIFHNKLIKCLSQTNTVNVISYRPFSKQLCTNKRLKKVHKEVKGISYNYLSVKRNVSLRKISFINETKTIVSKLNTEKALVIADCLNPQVIENAKKAAKKYELPIIGVFITSPSGVDGTPKEFTTHLIDLCKDLDGYICTTDELNEYFNREKKPYLKIEGIVENGAKTELNIKKPYIYYNGTLKEKLGVYNLIQAYKELKNNDVDLFISGYQANEDQLKEKVKGNPNIHLLFHLPYKDVIQYEKNSIANINCRPFSEDNDRYSIPFKVLDYLDAGVPAISVKNTKLMKQYKDNLIWIKSNSVSELKEAIKKILPLTDKEREDYASTGKRKVVKDYSYETTNKALDKFIKQYSK